MAKYRIIIGSWMVRYPLGGNLSWALQFVLGLRDLGHDVYVFEKAGYENSCFDMPKRMMSNDCTFGISVVSELLSRFSLDRNWCYVDYYGNYFGLSRYQIDEIFRTADLFIDSGSHGSWREEANRLPQVLIDGEPGFTQIKWFNNLQKRNSNTSV